MPIAYCHLLEVKLLLYSPNARSFSIQKVLANNVNISIWLDSYNDIFSDFDSRPFHERSLSDDFIVEARKMVGKKMDCKVELNLLLPTAQRNAEIESLIIKSLHSYFRNISSILIKEKIKQKALISPQ